MKAEARSISEIRPPTFKVVWWPKVGHFQLNTDLRYIGKAMCDISPAVNANWLMLLTIFAVYDTWIRFLSLIPFSFRILTILTPKMSSFNQEHSPYVEWYNIKTKHKSNHVLHEYTINSFLLQRILLFTDWGVTSDVILYSVSYIDVTFPNGNKVSGIITYISHNST